MSLLLVALRSLPVTKQHPFSRYRHASNVAPAFRPASQPTLHRAGIRTVANGASGAGVPGRPAVSGNDRSSYAPGRGRRGQCLRDARCSACRVRANVELSPVRGRSAYWCASAEPSRRQRAGPSSSRARKLNRLGAGSAAWGPCADRRAAGGTGTGPPDEAHRRKRRQQRWRCATAAT